MSNYSEFIEFLDWLARATGAVAVLLGILGLMFKEKWKQILQRALAGDVERLKAELTRENAEHAATLVPQLEQIKHDFQQKLEAYKIGLIAQAEAIKAQSDLKKTIALRFAEVQFERLIALELVLAPIGVDISAMGALNQEHREENLFTNALEKIRALVVACDQAEMFLSFEERNALLNFRQALITYASKYLTKGQPVAPQEDRSALILHASAAHTLLKNRINALGKFPTQD